MRPAERPVVKSATAGRCRPGCLASKLQGNWADLKGSNVSLFIPAWTNNSKVEAFGSFTGQVGYAWNNVLWYVKGGAAVDRGQIHGDRDHDGRAVRLGERNAVGVALSEQVSNLVCTELVSWSRVRSSVHGPPRRHYHIERCFWPGSRQGMYSAPTQSVRMLISQQYALITGSADQSPPGTDLIYVDALSPGIVRGFFHDPARVAFAGFRVLTIPPCQKTATGSRKCGKSANAN